MSDDTKVVNIAGARLKKVQAEEFRKHEEGHTLHEEGLAFRFEKFEYSDVESMGVGIMEGEMPICIVMNEDLSGICMSRESARRLGTDLLEAAEEEIINEEYEPTEGA